MQLAFFSFGLRLARTFGSEIASIEMLAGEPNCRSVQQLR
jgi:hypothetical protein